MMESNLADLSFPLTHSVDPDQAKKGQIRRLRDIAEQCTKLLDFEAAAFLYEKLMVINDDNLPDIYHFARCLFLSGQYYRAIHAIENCPVKKNLVLCHLLSLCYERDKQYEEALQIVGDTDADGTTEFEYDVLSTKSLCTFLGITVSRVLSNIAVLRGRLYEALDSRELAVKAYKHALSQDVFSVTAINNITQRHLMEAHQEDNLVKNLDFIKQDCTDEDAEMLAFLYKGKLKKYTKPEPAKRHTAVNFKHPGNERLTNSVDAIIANAERLFYNCQFMQCYELTKQVLVRDNLNLQCMPLYVSCLYELHDKVRLFDIGHILVKAYPEREISWFAVGTYYMAVEKQEMARRYLNKATLLDPSFGLAWLAIGHSFAIENEDDQASVAYFKAHSLMPGCHLPPMYIGLQYRLSKNMRMAERFLYKAFKLAPDDPFLLHELAGMKYAQGEYERAENILQRAILLLDKLGGGSASADKYEPLLNNMGHVCRKLGKLDEAIKYHKTALKVVPDNAGSLCAIGFCYSLKEDLMTAASYYHQALGINPNDTFATTMLGKCMERMSEDSSTDSDNLALMEVPTDPKELTVTRAQKEALDRRRGDIEETLKTGLMKPLFRMLLEVKEDEEGGGGAGGREGGRRSQASPGRRLPAPHFPAGRSPVRPPHNETSMLAEMPDTPAFDDDTIEMVQE